MNNAAIEFGYSYTNFGGNRFSRFDFGCHTHDSFEFEPVDDFGWKFRVPGSRWAKRKTKTIRRKAKNSLTTISRAAGTVPFVGPGLKGVFDITTGPISMTLAVANGVRIDKAVSRRLKADIRSVKAVAPYAQMVITLVPGVGTAAGAALSAGLALANGQPITAAIMAGVKGAVPGGAAAKMAYDVGLAAARGERVDKIAIAALPISNDQKKMLRASLDVVVDVARGKRVDKSLLKHSLKGIPSKYTKGLMSGLALGTGINVQKLAKGAVKLGKLNSLAKQGNRIIKGSGVLRSAGRILNKKGRRGFSLGMGLSKFAGSMGQISAIRGRIGRSSRTGFDLAMAAQMGKAIVNRTKGRRPKRRRTSVRRSSSRSRRGPSSAQVRRASSRSIRRTKKRRSRPTMRRRSTSKRRRSTTSRMSTTRRSSRLSQTNAKKFGFLVAKGLEKRPTSVKLRLIAVAKKDPAIRAGGKIAVRGTASSRPGWWPRFKAWTKKKFS